MNRADAGKSTGTVFNARDFGLSGGGGVETRAIQDAIDACSAAGGGTAYIPSGRYLSGTLFLKSNVNLHLSAGASIAGSSSRGDYNSDDIFPENPSSGAENWTGAHLVIAYCRENVSITGEGTIDGNSPAFFGPVPEGEAAATKTYRFHTGKYPVKDWRPGQMIFFCRCKNVKVQGVSLVNAPCWTLLFYGCADVHVNGLTVDNPPAYPTTDGIDIDCSRNVTVSDCIVRTGDDCITLRGSKRRLGDNAQPCENVTVTNCVLSSPTCAFRVGVGDGIVRRCSVSNIVVSEARTAVNMICSYTEASGHGVQIENIHFSDFTANVCMPIVIASGRAAAPPAAIRDISFSRFRAEVSAGSQITSIPAIPIERLRISDFEFHVREGTDNLLFRERMPDESSYPDKFKFGYHGGAGQPALPCVLYGSGLKDAVFDNVRIRWERPSGIWREGLLFRNSRGLMLKNLSMRQPEAKGAAIRCRDSERVEITGCRAEEGTDTFLEIAESSSEYPILSTGNDFSRAKTPLATDVPVRETCSLYGRAALEN